MGLVSIHREQKFYKQLLKIITHNWNINYFYWLMFDLVYANMSHTLNDPSGSLNKEAVIYSDCRLHTFNLVKG